MDLGLKGRKAIVLAASRGLGRAVAEVLAGEGCDLIICARTYPLVMETVDEIRRDHEVNVLGFQCDVSKSESLDRFFDEALEAFPSVDILVNNAGGPPAGEVETLGEDAWMDAVNLSLMSVVRACRRVLPVMKAKRFGRIINITSVSVKQYLPGMALSNTLRPAVAGYSKSLAMEAAPFGILVHCAMPGGFLTDRNRTLGAAEASKRNIPFDDLVREWTLSIPLGRMGDPLELGRMVAFLASEKCSFTTGTCVAMEGGLIRSI